jgi:hypothetical protein
MQSKDILRLDRIAFISSYCDRRCDRCEFAMRCSAYALEAATAMCDGDLAQGIELAIGTPCSIAVSDRPGGDTPETGDVLALESESYQREELARDARVEETPLMKLAAATTMTAHCWLSLRRGALMAHDDVVLNEALQTASWDATFVPAKLHRALDGHDRHVRGDEPEDDEIQNDWNGSAKVALLCLERSEHAWQIIADATREEAPASIAAAHADLQRLVLERFPFAMAFTRPGFDEPWR